MTPVVAIWIVAGVVCGGIVLVILYLLEPQLFEAPLRWKGWKGAAWDDQSVILDAEIGSDERIDSMVYTGSVRNPGCRSWSRVVRRWERSSEVPGRYLKGVAWEWPSSPTQPYASMRRGTVVYFVNAAQELCAVDIESGAQQWSVALAADLLHAPGLDDAGHWVAILDDSTWVQIDLGRGREVARGEAANESQIAAVLAGVRPVFSRVDSERAIAGDVAIELDGECEPGPSLVVSTAIANESGHNTRIASASAPELGTHRLELGGRALQSPRFAVCDDALVLLSGKVQPNGGVELFADALAPNRVGESAAVSLGWGGPSSSIDMAYPVGDYTALRLTEVRAHAEARGGGVVTCVLDPRGPRVVTRIPCGDADPVVGSW